jgi:hypothetical protein
VAGTHERAGIRGNRLSAQFGALNDKARMTAAEERVERIVTEM